MGELFAPSWLALPRLLQLHELHWLLCECKNRQLAWEELVCVEGSCLLTVDVRTRKVAVWACFGRAEQLVRVH